MASSCPTPTTTTQHRAERRRLLLAAIALWAIAAASAADPPCEDQEDSDSRDLRGGDSCAHIAAVGGCSHPEYGPQLREQCKKSCNSCQLCPETVNKTTSISTITTNEDEKDETEALNSAKDDVGDDDDGTGSFIGFGGSRPLQGFNEQPPRPCTEDHQCNTNYYCHKTVSIFKSSTESKEGHCQMTNNRQYRAKCGGDNDCESRRCRSGYMGGPNDSRKKQKICVCNTDSKVLSNFKKFCPNGAYRCGGRHSTVCIGHRPVDKGECGKNDGKSSGTPYTEKHSGKNYPCIKM